jgi:hypothetical protein
MSSGAVASGVAGTAGEFVPEGILDDNDRVTLPAPWS